MPIYTPPISDLVFLPVLLKKNRSTPATDGRVRIRPDNVRPAAAASPAPPRGRGPHRRRRGPGARGRPPRPGSAPPLSAPVPDACAASFPDAGDRRRRGPPPRRRSPPRSGSAPPRRSAASPTPADPAAVRASPPATHRPRRPLPPGRRAPPPRQVRRRRAPDRAGEPRESRHCYSAAGSRSRLTSLPRNPNFRATFDCLYLRNRSSVLGV